MNRKFVSRLSALICAALTLTAAGSLTAAEIPETPYYFDADYIVNGTAGTSGKAAHEFWRHSVAELVEEDGKTCLKMVAASDEKYPTQVNIYWADSGASVADGAIDFNEYPFMLMSYKSSLAGEWELVTGDNKAYYDKIGKITADEWSTSIVNVKTSSITKGSYLQVADNIRIRFWGEAASSNYVNAEFYLEYIAFFKTSADAEAYVKSLSSSDSAETPAQTTAETTTSPKTSDILALTLFALTASGAAVVLLKKKHI